MTDLTWGGDDFNRTLSLHPSHLQSFMGRRAVHFQYFQGSGSSPFFKAIFYSLSHKNIDEKFLKKVVK